MPRILRSLAALVALTSALSASPAEAAPPDAIEHARQLFVQAEADEDAERWSDALEKLGAVAQVKLTAGVRYHIALCEEHLGRLVRALGDYKAAAEQARTESAKDVLRTVGKQLDALESRVPRLTILAEPGLSGASVMLDGERLDAPLGNAIPVDPGAHTVEAVAPDRRGAGEIFTLQEHESRVIELRLPDPEPPTTVTTPPPVLVANSTPVAPRPRGVAIVATGAAVVLAGGGAAAFLFSGDNHDRAVRDCAQSLVPCAPVRDQVRAWDFAAAGMWSAALVAGVVAVVLWTRPNDVASKGDARLIVGPRELGVEGHF